MRLTREPGLTFFGVHSGLPDTYRIELNQRELATLKRAIAIREEVRDRLRDGMGIHEFEASDLYTLRIDDLIESDPSWFEYPHKMGEKVS